MNVFADCVYVRTNVIVPAEYIQAAAPNGSIVILRVPSQSTHHSVSSDDMAIKQYNLKPQLDTLYNANGVFTGYAKMLETNKLVFTGGLEKNFHKQQEANTYTFVGDIPAMVNSKSQLDYLQVMGTLNKKLEPTDKIKVSVTFRLPMLEWSFKHELFVTLPGAGFKPSRLLSHIDLSSIFPSFHKTSDVEQISFVNRNFFQRQSHSYAYATEKAKRGSQEEAVADMSVMPTSANELGEWVIERPYFDLSNQNRFCINNQELGVGTSIIYIDVTQNVKKCNPQIMLDFNSSQTIQKLAGIESGPLDVFNNSNSLILSGNNQIHSQTRRLFVGSYSAIEGSWLLLSEHKQERTEDWEITITNKSNQSLDVDFAYNSILKLRHFSLKNDKDINQGIMLEHWVEPKEDPVDKRQVVRTSVTIRPGISKRYFRLFQTNY